MSKFVPYATRKRLAMYYKVIKSLEKKNIQKITSNDLSELIKIDPTTIRRDFSEIGSGNLGKKGAGYDISSLVKVFEDVFELNKLESVILVGLGHLGSAVGKYFDVQDRVAFISQIYDLNPEIIGTKYIGLEVLDYNKISEYLDTDNTKIAILTVPGEKAQSVSEELIDLGINGIVNFTGSKIFSSNKDVIISDMDIAQTMQSLIYDMKNIF